MDAYEFYKTIGGDYEEMKATFSKDERIVKFVKMFEKDDSYPQLIEALEAKNVEVAYRAAHTLKGVCLNLHFTRLFEVTFKVMTDLKNGDFDAAMTGMPAVTEEYNRTIEAIGQLA